MSASILLFAGMLDHEGGREQPPVPPPSALLRRLYVDTMGFNPHTIRFAVETLGADHVLVGSDWPIMPIASRSVVDAALDGAGIRGDDRDRDSRRQCTARSCRDDDAPAINEM